MCMKRFEGENIFFDKITIFTTLIFQTLLLRVGMCCRVQGGDRARAGDFRKELGPGQERWHQLYLTKKILESLY